MCPHRCCRKHCCALGGCGVKGHDSDPVLDDTLQLCHQPNTDTFPTEPSIDETVCHATHNAIPHNSPLPLQSTVPMPSLNLPPSHSPVDQSQAAGPAAADDPEAVLNPSLRPAPPSPAAARGPDSVLDLSLRPTPPIQPSFAGPSRIVDKGKGKDPAENPRSSQLKRKAAAVPLADQPCHTMHLNPIFTRLMLRQKKQTRATISEPRSSVRQRSVPRTRLCYMSGTRYVFIFAVRFHLLITLVMI